MFDSTVRIALPTAIGSILLLVIPLTGSSATITTAVLEGDAVVGVGLVTRIDNLAVNDSGSWLVEADTDNANVDADQVLLRDGSLHLREMQALAQPIGSNLDTFDSINLNNLGDSGWNFFLDGTAGSSDDSGIYFNTTLVVQESDVSTSPDFSPGTPYIGFFDAKISANVSELIMTVASVDDPAIATSVDRAIVLLRIDGSGNLLAENVLAKEGDFLPGQAEAVADFGTGPHQSAINDQGSVLFFADLTGDTSSDGVIYLDGTLLAQERSASPVAGRNYEFLSSRSMDLGGTHHVFKANLDGSTSDDELIVRDGAVFRREGDSLPAIAGFSLTSFGTGSGPVEIDESGNVLWYGDWDDPNTDIDTGLFLNDELLVQEGVTTIDGLLVDTISSGQDAFRLSENGSWAIFEATLLGGLNGAFLIELESAVDAVATSSGSFSTALSAARPSPFQDETAIRFSLAEASHVELTIFDVTGRLVETLVSGPREAGDHVASWNGRDRTDLRVARGTYFVRLRAGSVETTRKVVYLGR